jgi:hypothetical protein
MKTSSFGLPGVDIDQIQIERGRRLVPSATFLNTDATRPGFGPACFAAVVGRCLDPPAPGYRRARRKGSTHRSGIEKHGSASRT